MTGEIPASSSIPNTHVRCISSVLSQSYHSKHESKNTAGAISENGTLGLCQNWAFGKH